MRSGDLKLVLIGGIALAILFDTRLMSGGRAFAQTEAGSVELSINANTLGEALTELSKQARTPLLYPYDLADLGGVNPVNGVYSVSDALELMFQGTEFSGHLTEGGIIAVSLKPKKGQEIPEGNVNNKKARQTLLASVAAALVGPIAPAQAEEPKEDGVKELDVVIVTANKREQDLQDVSASISALTPEEISKRGLESFDDFARSIPGVSFVSEEKNRSRFTIRGVAGPDAVSRIQDPTAIYINDFPAVSSYFAIITPDLRLYDVERVEVLRGPQGTLFGSGSLGGAVRVITREPSLTETEGSARIDLSLTEAHSFSQRYSAMVNLPVVNDELAVRVVGYFRDEGGYVDNIDRGVEDANETQDWGARVAIKWSPNERFEGDFTFIHQESDPKDGSAVIETPDRSLVRNGLIPSATKSEITFYNLGLNYQFDFADLVSSTTYSKTFGDQEASTRAGPLGVAFTSTQDSEFFAQEFRLVSNQASDLEWTLGTFFLSQDIEGTEQGFVVDPGGLSFTGFIDDPNGSLFNDIPNAIDAREFAIFGDASYNLTDRLSISGGLRWADSEIEADSEGVAFVSGLVGALFAGGGDIRGSSVVFDYQNEATDSVLTGRASLSYQVNENSKVYLLASRGYRNGQPNGVNGPDPVDPMNGVFIPEAFEPDALWNYELGAKMRLFDNRLTANLAAYYIDWSNFQVNGFRSSDLLSFVTNSGDVEVLGLEAELLASASDHFDFGLNLTFQEGEVASISAEDSVLSGAARGDEAPFTPSFMASGFAQLSYPLNRSEIYARADVQHVGSSVNGFSSAAGSSGAPNSNFRRIDSYENVNLSLGYDTERWSAALYVNNALNSDNYIRISQGGGLLGLTASVLRPRTTGLRLDMRF